MSDNERITKVTKSYLKKKTKEFDISCIYSLNLSSLGIFDLGCIGECSGLVILDVSNNNISSAKILAPLKQLQILRISSNRLSDLGGINELESLWALDLSGNFISTVDSLAPLAKLEKFGNLRLQDAIKGLSNPVYQNIAKHREDILALLPCLKILDGDVINGKGGEFSDLCCELDTSLKACEESIKMRQDVSLKRMPCPFIPQVSSECQLSSSNSIAKNEERLARLLEECEKANAKAKRVADDAEKSLQVC